MVDSAADSSIAHGVSRVVPVGGRRDDSRFALDPPGNPLRTLPTNPAESALPMQLCDLTVAGGADTRLPVTANIRRVVVNEVPPAAVYRTLVPIV